jgi:hypothetical protein
MIGRGASYPLLVRGDGTALNADILELPDQSG